MTLPSSGSISMSQVDTELGYSSTATISLNDSAVRSLFGVSSGQISMSQGYGKSNTPAYSWYYPGNNYFGYLNGSTFNTQGNGVYSWCIETWVYPYYTNNNQNTTIFAIGNGGAYGNGICCEWFQNAFNFYQGQNPSWSNANSINSGASFGQQTWWHYCVTLYGGNVTMYINGSYTNSTGDGSGGNTASGAAVLNGVVDNRGFGYGGMQQYQYNLRWTENNPVYYGNFTPPTSPLGDAGGSRFVVDTTSNLVDRLGYQGVGGGGSGVVTGQSFHP